MRIRLDLDRNYQDRLVRSSRLASVLGTVAGTLAEEAKRQAPRTSGRYRDGIAGESGTDDLGPVGRVNAHHWTSWFIEAGTTSRPASAPLRKALGSGAARQVLR